MSVSKPPPESEQLIATGDNTQTDQPTGMDSSKKQTVTLTLNVDDILEGEIQRSLNGREFSVSGQVKFTFKNSSEKERRAAEDNNLTSQPLPSAQQEYSLESQKHVDSIDKSNATLKEASGLLLSCADKLEEMKTTLNSLSESDQKSKDFEQEVKREIKSTTEAVMGMLKDLAGDSATVTTNDDDDDHSPDDDKDSGSGNADENPNGGDTSGKPTNPQDDPPKKDDDPAKDCDPTKSSAEQQSEQESTEDNLVETTTAEIDKAEDSLKVVLPLSEPTQNQEKQAELTESIPEERSATKTSVTLPLETESGDGEVDSSASEVNKETIVEDKKQDDDDAVQQKAKEELGESTEEAPIKGASPQQELQEPSALGDLPLTVLTEKPGEQEEMKELPAPGVDEKEGDSEETPDAGVGSQQTTEPSQEPSTPAESAIEETSSDNKVDNSSEESPIEETSPQQGAELSQDPPAPEDLARSASTEKPEKQELKEASTKDVPDVEAGSTLALAKDKSGESEPSPPAPGVDKKGGDSEETPDAGSSPQPSTPTESVSEETPSYNTTDNSGKDTVPEPNVDQQEKAESDIDQDRSQEMNSQVSESSERNKNKNKKKKQQKKDKKEAARSKNMRAEDEPLFSMDVMLSLYFVTVIDIQAQNMDPRQMKLSGFLEEICVFPQKDDYKKYADIVPQNLFDKVLGKGWNERKNIASTICRQLVHFFAQATAKTSAQGIIAYLNCHHEKLTNPATQRGKVLTMKQLFSKINEELSSWIPSQWTKNSKEYMGHRWREIDDSWNRYSWRDKPTKYTDNPRFTKRIAYYKTNLKTFEDRLISACYKYLTIQKQSVKKYNDVLDFDLDYVCEWPDNLVQPVELVFFGVLFDFDTRLKKLFDETANDEEELGTQDPVPPTEASGALEEPTPPPVSETEGKADCTDKEESHEDSEEKPKDEQDAPSKQFISEITFPILFSTMKSIRTKKLTLDEVNFPDRLKEVYMFHTTKEWKNNYKDEADFQPELLFSKLFGPHEAWKDTNGMDHQFCKAMAINFANDELEVFVKELLAFMDYSHTNSPENSGDNTVTTKIGSFARTFAVTINNDSDQWICSKFEKHLYEYFLYQADRKEQIPEVEKYCWRPEPEQFPESSRLKDRMDYHAMLAPQNLGHYIIFSFYNYIVKYHESNEFLDSDLEYILARPDEKSIKRSELKYFNTVLGLNKWTHWFSSYVLNLIEY